MNKQNNTVNTMKKVLNAAGFSVVMSAVFMLCVLTPWTQTIGGGYESIRCIDPAHKDDGLLEANYGGGISITKFIGWGVGNLSGFADASNPDLVESIAPGFVRVSHENNQRSICLELYAAQLMTAFGLVFLLQAKSLRKIEVSLESVPAARQAQNALALSAN